MTLEMTRWEKDEKGFVWWKVTQKGGEEVSFPTVKVIERLFAKACPAASRRIKIEGPYSRGRFIYVAMELGLTDLRRARFIKALETKMTDLHQSSLN